MKVTSGRAEQIIDNIVEEALAIGATDESRVRRHALMLCGHGAKQTIDQAFEGESLSTVLDAFLVRLHERSAPSMPLDEFKAEFRDMHSKYTTASDGLNISTPDVMDRIYEEFCKAAGIPADKHPLLKVIVAAVVPTAALDTWDAVGMLRAMLDDLESELRGDAP